MGQVVCKGGNLIELDSVEMQADLPPISWVLLTRFFFFGPHSIKVCAVPRGDTLDGLCNIMALV